MTIFSNYADYYDLMYQDKPYDKEVAFVETLLHTFSKRKISRLLELGCGTGKHACLLAERGYQLTGVDRSARMLEAAGSLVKQRALESQVHLVEGDLQTLTLSDSFDAVIALFHVMSYQDTEEALAEAFQTVKRHLVPGGLFLFDCWYGPAVLYEKPAVRLKQWQKNGTSVLRIAAPELDVARHCVTVRYHIFAQESSEMSYHKIEETHVMRYLFQTDIDRYSRQSGMQCLFAKEWLTQLPLNETTWNATFVLKA